MTDAERYDALLDAGREPPTECPICTGDRDAAPCSEDCDRIIKVCEAERQVETCRMAARLVIKVAKSYQREGFPDDHRIAACIGRVRYYRDQVRTHRARLSELRRAA